MGQNKSPDNPLHHLLPPTRGRVLRNRGHSFITLRIRTGGGGEGGGEGGGRGGEGGGRGGGDKLGQIQKEKKKKKTEKEIFLIILSLALTSAPW